MHRRLARVLAAATVAVATLAVPTATVIACSCVATEPTQVVENADVAFIGTVIRVATSDGGDRGGVPYSAYDFKVERASGDVGMTAEVFSFGDNGTCGISFATGERWFIGADRTERGVETDLCSGNQRIAPLTAGQFDEIAALLPYGPERETAAVAEGTTVPTPVLVAGGVAALLVAFGLLAFRRAK